MAVSFSNTFQVFHYDTEYEHGQNKIEHSRLNESF